MPSLPDMTTPDVVGLAAAAAAKGHPPPSTTKHPPPAAPPCSSFSPGWVTTPSFSGTACPNGAASPVLEEDIGTANIALDLIGQTQRLGLAGEVDGNGRSADDLAFLRDVWDFRNVLLVERPNGDFGHTIMRQFLFDAWHVEMLRALMRSSDQRIAEIAAKAIKEVSYHVEKSADLVVRLGDGTDESHRRMQRSLDEHWTYTGELFLSDAADEAMVENGIAPDPASLKPAWETTVRSPSMRRRS